MEGAVYFPLINVPDNPWLLHSLLYWDSVAAIIPEPLLDEPERLSETTRRLLREGLVLNALPASAHNGFAYAFGEYLAQLPTEELARRRARLAAGETTFIHRDKLLHPAVPNQLVELGLAEKRERSNWLAVESDIARDFMAGLVLALCHPKSRWSQHFRAERAIDRWHPATDKPRSLEALMTGFAAAPTGDRKAELLRLRVRGELKASELRSIVLEDLLPVPDGPVPVDDILRFRRKHGRLLPQLRLDLEARLDEALQIVDPDLQVRHIDRLIDEGRQRIDEARAYLRESGLRYLKDSTLVRIFKFIPGVGGPVGAAQEIAGGMVTHPDFESEPLAYLAFANERFAAKPEYIVDARNGMPLALIMEQQTAAGPGYISEEEQLAEERRAEQEMAMEEMDDDG